MALGKDINILNVYNKYGRTYLKQIIICGPGRRHKKGVKLKFHPFNDITS
jgi:hypothetical protein